MILAGSSFDDFAAFGNADAFTDHFVGFHFAGHILKITINKLLFSILYLVSGSFSC